MGDDIARYSVSLREIKFGNSSQKASTNRYQIFLVLTSFSGFLYFVPNLLCGIAAPRRGCLGYSKVLCDVRKRWLLTWNQNRHITYSIFHILTPRMLPELHKCPHFVCLGKFVDISCVNYFGAILVYELRTLQIPGLSIFTLFC